MVPETNDVNISGGIVDDLIKRLVKIGFDKSKLDLVKINAGVGKVAAGLLAGISLAGGSIFDKTKIDVVLVEEGAGLVLDGIEVAVTSPGNLDAMLFDAIKSVVHNVLIDLKSAVAPNHGPLIVGAKPHKKPFRSREEVEKIIADNGMQVTEFAPWVLLLAQFLPLVLDLVKWLRERKNGG